MFARGGINGDRAAVPTGSRRRSRTNAVAARCVLRTKRDRGSGERHDGRRVARRHRRSVEPRVDRADAFGDHRLSGPIQDSRPASRHVQRHLLASGICDGEARRDRAAGELHRAGQRRAARRRRRGNHHGLGRIARRRRTAGGHAASVAAAAARRGADRRPEHSVGGRHARRRHAVTARRRRRAGDAADLYRGARQRSERQLHHGGRHPPERDRGRWRHPAVLQRRHVLRDELPDRWDLRRVVRRRRPVEHDPERRRQCAQRRRVLLGDGKLASVQPADARARRAGPSGRECAGQRPRSQYLRRRTDHSEQSMVLRVDAPLGREPDARELVLFGDAVLADRHGFHAGLVAAGGRQQFDQELHGARHVAGESKEQTELLPRSNHQIPRPRAEQHRRRQQFVVRGHVQHAPAEAVLHDRNQMDGRVDDEAAVRGGLRHQQ